MGKRELKQTAAAEYETFVARSGFNDRESQRAMIDFIVDTLGEGNGSTGVVEAGTGTGKTLAYSLGGIVAANDLNCQLVIVTRTIAAQEQVVNNDLPLLQDYSDLDFSFAVAKGRSRYVCTRRLYSLASPDESLVSDDVDDVTPKFRQLLGALTDSVWNGEREDWPSPVTERDWKSVTTDHWGCSGRDCEFYSECPYYRSIDERRSANVVVTNYDLLLTSVRHSAYVLPELSDSLYVFDEAHHLCEVATQVFTRRVTTAEVNSLIRATREVMKGMCSLAEEIENEQIISRVADALTIHLDQAAEWTRQVVDFLSTIDYQVDAPTPRYRFAFGTTPSSLREVCQLATDAMSNVVVSLNELRTEFQEVNQEWKFPGAEACLEELNELLGRAEENLAALLQYASSHDYPDAARWVNSVGANDNFELVSVPLDVDAILRESIWDETAGTVCTSATMCTAGDDFSYFLREAGLYPDTPTLRIESHFDYSNNVVLSVPYMALEPNDSDYELEIASKLPHLLRQEKSALVLFTSWRSLDRVYENLDGSARSRCLVQGTLSKSSLIDQHIRAIEQGRDSYIFAVASFMESIDLPGRQCEHVVITRIPFQVPTDPLFMTRSEVLEEDGSSNSFMSLSLPDATLKLVQACGRLIRSESDRGRITMLDRRILTRRYGSGLLAALPDYTVEVEDSE